MQQLSAAGQAAIDATSQRHGFSQEAVLSMLYSVIAGNGSMAQFNHSEFGGSGQWMRGGMIMTSDMFNHGLKGRIDALCLDLSGLISSQPDLIRTGSFQSQSQGPSQQQYGQSQGGSSLFVPPPSGYSIGWWGADLGSPASAGSQNNVRYAYFPQARRLAIEVHGKVTVYDTLDHSIGGFSQQQSHGASLAFTSQHGLVEVSSLPVVDGEAPGSLAPRPEPQSQPFAARETVMPPPAPSALPSAPVELGPSSNPSAGGSTDIFATLEKLAELRAKGILTEDEFSAKKAELLSRL